MTICFYALATLSSHHVIEGSCDWLDFWSL